MCAFSVIHLRNRFAGLLIFVFPFLLLAARTSAAELSPATPIKILTFNIMWEENGVRAGNLSLPVWEDRRTPVARLITDAAADIVGFQEASPEQQVGLRAELPGYTLVFHAATNNPNPILFKTGRFQLIDSGAFVLNDKPEIEGTNIGVRSSTWVHLQDRKTRRHVWVYNLHLDHRSKGPTRQISAVRLAEQLSKRDGTVFVTGDFNTPRSSPTMTFLFGRTALKNDSDETAESPRSLIDACESAHPDPTKRVIDHVLASPDVTVKRAGRIASGAASDHDMVWTEVLLE
jgi:endonuclease/exonuclease/phosphatase family metal-dependent hydrolase